MNHRKTTLPNGVRIITVPMKDNPTVTIMINVATGSYYENPTESGISHFLEHMCFKGTTKRPTPFHIAAELDGIGANYNAFTGNEITGYWVKADILHFHKIGDVVSDIYLNSTFPEKEIEKEKGVVTGEIDMYADDPQEKIHDALREHMYKGEPAERDVLGTKKTVESFTREHLLTYRTTQYKASNTVLTIAGGISEEAMLAWATQTFGAMPSGLPKTELATHDRVQTGPETVFLDKDTDQTHIILAWRTFDRNHPDRYVAGLIRMILRGGMSSRLFTKLRDEMGSGYYIGASNALSATFGRFTISTGTRSERAGEIIAAVLAETERLKKELVSPEELMKVKEQRRAGMLMSLETSDDVADFYADQETVESRVLTPSELDVIYSNIKAEDIMRVAGAIFDRQKLTVALIGKGIDTKEINRSIITV